MRKIAIIPARGGSKRIPRKNVKPFFGKPIIAYSLQSAMESQLFDHVHVSTEDREIYDIVSNLGFKPGFYRSSDCSQDHVPVKEVLVESLQEFEKQGESFDIFCLLSATAPLISSIDLIEAYEVFEKNNFLFPLLAVAKYSSPIERAMEINEENNTLRPLDKRAFLGSTHNLKEKYHDVGSFAFFTKGQLLNKNAEIEFIPYVLPFIKNVDIDNSEDWNFLEILYSAHKKFNKKMNRIYLTPFFDQNKSTDKDILFTPFSGIELKGKNKYDILDLRFLKVFESNIEKDKYFNIVDMISDQYILSYKKKYEDIFPEEYSLRFYQIITKSFFFPIIANVIYYYIYCKKKLEEINYNECLCDRKLLRGNCPEIL